MSPFRRFTAMIVVSTLVMFGLLYLNTYELDHVFFSRTRANLGIATASLLIFAGSLCGGLKPGDG